MQKRCSIMAFGLLAIAAAVAPAQADQYPDKPIRVISDSAPGSAIDVTFRMVMDRLGKKLGQQIVAVAQPGASGAIAADAAAKAAPDGYTYFASALSLFISLPGKAPNLPLIMPRDFLPVGSLVGQPLFICASAKSGIKTLPDLIARAKRHPGQISFAATGIGRLTHLTGLLLESRAGIKLQVVPYTGGPAAALTDVIGGRVPVIIEGYSGLAGAIQAHTLNVLAVGSTHRLPDFPNAPTAAETLPGFASGGWQGMVAPLGTPAPDIHKINEALKKVLAEPDLAKQLADRGAFVDAMTPPEVNAFINAQQAQWKPVLQPSRRASINSSELGVSCFCARPQAVWRRYSSDDRKRIAGFEIQSQGWGAAGATPVAIGDALSTELAALRTHAWPPLLTDLCGQSRCRAEDDEILYSQIPAVVASRVLEATLKKGAQRPSIC